MINPMYNHNYIEIANLLKLPTLQSTRKLQDVIPIYKVLKGRTNSNLLLYNFEPYVNVHNTRRNMILKEMNCKTHFLYHSSIPR